MKHRFSSRAWSLIFLWACAAGAENRFTLIDYPGASGTQAWGINSRGDIAGYYVGADKNNQGFLLNGGLYTAIDYPGAAVKIINGINPQGDVVGGFGATAATPHRGFLLGAGGVYTAFDIGINAWGEIAGLYTQADANRHSFLSSAGRLIRIEYPGASQPGVIGITPQGEGVGAYMLNVVAHAFVYSTGGGFTTIDYPGATYTNATGRNSSGDLVGRYLDSDDVSRSTRKEIQVKERI